MNELNESIKTVFAGFEKQQLLRFEEERCSDGRRAADSGGADGLCVQEAPSADNSFSCREMQRCRIVSF